MKRCVAVALAVVFAVGIVQASPPPEGDPDGRAGLDQWAERVEQFIGLLERDDTRAGQRLLAGRSVMQTFRGEPTSGLHVLSDAVAGGAVFFVRAYEQAPANLAGELAAAVEQSGAVPQEVRQWLIPADEHAMAAANAAAREWVTQSLHLRRPAPVAVVAVWRPARAGVLSASAAGDLFFLLLRSDAELGGIDRIVFGVPVAMGMK